MRYTSLDGHNSIVRYCAEKPQSDRYAQVGFINNVITHGYHNSPCLILITVYDWLRSHVCFFATLTIYL